MVSLHVDILVHHDLLLLRRATGEGHAPLLVCPRREVGTLVIEERLIVLAELVPRRDHPGNHIIQPLNGHRPVQHSPRELRPPQALAILPHEPVARHGHVEASEGARDAGALGEPVRHDEALEAHLVLQHAAEQLGVSAGGRVVDHVVRAHDASDARAHGVGEGPAVDLVQRAVIHVAGERAGEPGLARLAEVLLLVGDEVLDGGHDVLALDAADGLGARDALEVRVRAEALPVAAAGGHAAERADAGAQQDVDALEAGLEAVGGAAEAHERAVEGCAHGDAGREGCCVVGEAEA